MHDSTGNDDVQRVRDASDIVRVVGEHIELRAKGREYVGLCPFHDDKKPSMNVVPAKQIFHCFSCGAGGDVFTFVQDYHKMTFREALKFLAERAGVKLESRGRRRTASDDADSVSRSMLLEANELADKFFRMILRHPEHGKTARELIDRRGITQDMVDAFGLGAAPDRWDGLAIYLNEKGHSLDPFLNAGLLKSSDQGKGPYDAQRNRLVFPIRDQIGRVVAFGGRRINDEDEPKYINSAESVLFDKSGTLFGLDLASRSIQKEGVAVIAEGYTDVIACHQAGLTNAIATLGTALTPKHAKLLQRLCHTVVLLFDGDEAGQKAADRAVEVFLTLPIDAKIATLAGHTDAKDPDELLKREDGLAVMRTAIADATELLEYRIGRLRTKLAAAGAAQTERAIRDELRSLGALGLASADKVRWQFVIRRLSELTGLEAQTIADLVREGASRGSRGPTFEELGGSQQAPTESHRHRSLNAEILGCLLAMPERWISLGDDVDRLCAAVGGTRYQAVYEAMLTAAENTGRTEMNTVVDQLRQRDEDHRVVVQLEQDVTRRLGGNREQIAETLRVCLRDLAQIDTVVEAKPETFADRMARVKAMKEKSGPNTRLLPRVSGVAGQAGSPAREDRDA